MPMLRLFLPLRYLYLTIYSLLSLQIVVQSDANAHSHTHCKAVPGTTSWPSPLSWSALNESTGGRLLQAAPPGAVCHPGQPSYHPALCPAAQSGWSTYEFHAADPVSSDWNHWNNDSCLPDRRYPCSGAGYPVFVMNATEAAHVREAVRFAGKHDVRLVVKSSGHDYLGRSSGPNSMSVWTHHMKGLQVHESFRPKCCKVKIEGGSVTLGAGTQMGEIYDSLDALNRTIVGGGAKTVSVGGYITGGGHSLLSARYGLAADQVLEMEIVTPRGEILMLNECKNKDLFWAMRGGGGSTFGVMTSVTVKTYPTPPLVSMTLLLATLDPGPYASSITDVITYFLSQFPSLGDAGVSGYTFMVTGYPNPVDGGNTTVGGVYALLAIQDTQDLSAMLKVIGPTLAHIAATWPGYVVVPNVTAYPSFRAWFQDYSENSPAGSDLFVGSRLLDERALTADPDASKAAYAQLMTGGGVGTAHLVGGKGVRDAKPRGGGDAVLPAWRKSYVHLTRGTSFPPLNATARAEALVKLDYYIEGLRKLAPDTGAYMNEANPQEPDWQHQFWGENYDRLVEIKRAVDPDDVLWCTPCVGNERWQEVDGHLCRV